MKIRIVELNVFIVVSQIINQLRDLRMLERQRRIKESLEHKSYFDVFELVPNMLIPFTNILTVTEIKDRREVFRASNAGPS